MLFAISDVVWQALIAGAVTVVLAVIQVAGAFITRQQLKANADEAARNAVHVAAKVDQVAVQANEVKNTLTETNATTTAKLDGLAAVARSTHVLVNERYGLAITKLAAALEIIAARPGATQWQIADAKQAAKDRDDHNARQREVDAQHDTDREKKGEGRP